MINRQRGEVAITIDGHECVLRPTMDAVVKWEDALGRGTLQIARDLSMQTVRTTDTISILEAAATNGLKRSDLEAEVERTGILTLYNAALELIRNTLERGAQPQTGEGEADQTTG